MPEEKQADRKEKKKREERVHSVNTSVGDEEGVKSKEKTQCYAGSFPPESGEYVGDD